jgi:hypothetical protein
MKERALDRSFASAEIDAETLRLLMAEIGRLQAETRRVHLHAHVEQRSILTPAHWQRTTRSEVTRRTPRHRIRADLTVIDGLFARAKQKALRRGLCGFASERA